MRESNQNEQKSIGSDVVYFLYLLNVIFFLAVMGCSAFLVHGVGAHVLEIVVSIAYAIINGVFFNLFSHRNRRSKKKRTYLGLDFHAGDSVVETLYEGYYEVDLQGQIKAFNASLADILNFPASHLQDRSITEFVNSDVAFRLVRAAHHVYHNELSNRAFPLKYMRKEGKRISLEVSITLIYDKHGRKTGFRGIVRNVSERERQERARAESEARLRALLCAIPDAIIFKNADYQWLEANQTALNMFQLRDADYYGKTNEELVRMSNPFHDHGEIFNESDRRAIDCGETITFESVVEFTPLIVKAYEIRKIPVFDERGLPFGVLSIARDISLQRDMQMQLIESEHRNRSFIEHLHDGVMWFDLEGFVIDANPASYSILGHNDSFIGSSIQHFVYESNVRSVLAAFARAARGELQEGVYKVYRTDGSLIDVYLRQSPMIMRDQQVGVFAIFRDITEERRTTMELEDLSRKQRAVLQSAGEGIYGFDLDGKITFCNASALALTGYREEEVIGRFMHEIFYRLENRNSSYGEIDCITSFFKRDDHNEEIVDVMRCENELFWRKDGSMFYVDYTMSLMIDEGSVVGAVCLFNDVTERKEAEQLLLQSEKLAVVGQLAAGIVHEIRNPLTVIKGFLRFSENGHFKSDYVVIMNKEIERIETIIQEFLILARPQAMNLHWYDVNQLLTDALTPLQSFILQNNVAVEMHISSPLPLIQCEEMQLRQAFMNVLKNAIEALPLGGHLTITAKVMNEDKIHVLIADDGCGMDEQQLKNLGTPFYTTKQNGTGLGLTVSQKIAELHHGTLHMRSDVGRGTTVEFIFPVEHQDRTVYASAGRLFVTRE